MWAAKVHMQAQCKHLGSLAMSVLVKGMVLKSLIYISKVELYTIKAPKHGHVPPNHARTYPQSQKLLSNGIYLSFGRVSHVVV